MKVVIIKLRNQKEWVFLSNLLKRLNLPFEWSEVKMRTSKKQEPKRDIISELFGSFPSDKTGDELAQSIRDARVNQKREISL
jgi:hypothetical protein